MIFQTYNFIVKTYLVPGTMSDLIAIALSYSAVVWSGARETKAYGSSVAGKALAPSVRAHRTVERVLKNFILNYFV
jgi:hypothetical protein